jgi:hypothetical protein
MRYNQVIHILSSINKINQFSPSIEEIWAGTYILECIKSPNFKILK